MQVELVNLTSKKGKPFTAIKVKLLEYEGLLFPTRAELAYIKDHMKEINK